MFTGASQFALVGVLAAGGTPLAAGLTALLLGTRNTLYGLRVGPLLGWTGGRRVAAAHLLIDESTAMAIDPPHSLAGPGRVPGDRVCRSSCCGTSSPSSARVAGNALGDPRTYGLDAAVGAAFLALLWPRLRRPPQPGRRARGRRGRPRTRAGHRRRRTGARRRRRRAPGRPAPAGADPTEIPEPRDEHLGGGHRRRDRLLPAQAGRPLDPAARRSSTRSSSGSPTSSRSRCSPRWSRSRSSRRGRRWSSTRGWPGSAAAFVLLLLRAPFLVVVFGAALVAALLRLL